VDIFDAYENWCQVGLKHTLFAYRFFFATLELFYLAALENPHAELNGVENGVEVGGKGAVNKRSNVASQSITVLDWGLQQTSI
jgi:hypothetical protein